MDKAGRPCYPSSNVTVRQPREPLRSIDMPYIIAEPCIGTKDASCVAVCPVDCIYESSDQYYIDPDECIDCGAGEPSSSGQAMSPPNGVPASRNSYIEKNRELSEARNK